jgi:hypothetical protein
MSDAADKLTPSPHEGPTPDSMDSAEVDHLTQTVRVLIAKGDKAAAKSEQFYVAAGQHLKTLKTQHKGSWAEWEDLLKERCGLGKSRASELMRIANGTTTVEQIRSEKAESVRKVRAASPLRSGESREVAVVEQDEPDTKPYPVDDVEESAARRKAEAAEEERDREEARRLFAAVEAAEAEREAASTPTNVKSWRVEVLAKDGRWFENGIRLATEEEIDVYRFLHVGQDFWKTFDKFPVVPVATFTFRSADEPNVRFHRKKNGKLTPTIEFPHGGCVWFGWTEVGTEVRSTLLWNAEAPAKPTSSVEQSAEQSNDAPPTSCAAGDIPEAPLQPSVEAVEPISNDYPEMPTFLER